MPAARKDSIKWIPGHYYHIYNRGANRSTIFLEEMNYIFVLQRMKEYSAKFLITVVAYCLMPNHYHWLLRQDAMAEAGLLPQSVFNSYTKAFNKMYERSGTLFQARFKAKHIDSDEYLRHLCCYIHANPIKHGLTYDLALWPYSNYHEFVGQRKGKLVDQQFVATMFPDPAHYQTLVMEYVCQKRLPDPLAQYLSGLDANW